MGQMELLAVGSAVITLIFKTDVNNESAISFAALAREEGVDRSDADVVVTLGI
jgi:predicted nucleotidyltransferase